MKKVKRFRCGKLKTFFEARRNRWKNISTDDIDGGVVTSRSGNDAPKVIISTDIISFSCVISLLAHIDEPEYDNAIYTFDAKKKDGSVICMYEWYKRNEAKSYKTSFEANDSFMISLQKIVSELNIAQFNGYYHYVSGLPNMYGNSISIDYSSGENIYAKDNQRGFLPRDTLKELLKLFQEANDKK